jgi:hypothetical protein
MKKTDRRFMMTPRRAIRRYCVDFCMNGQPYEVKLCPDKKCALYEHRFGKIPDNQKLTPCKAIKARCRDCQPESYIKNCEFTICQLYTYREGHNPNLKGKRGSTPKGTFGRKKI